MSILENFTRQLDEIRDRTARLRSEHRPALPLLDEAMEELEVASEELRVFDEEVRAQQEHIGIVNQAVAAERDRYLALFEFAPDGYLTTDNCGMIIEANRSASIMLNVPAAYLTGKPLVNFIAFDSRASFRTELGAPAATDQQRVLEVTMQPRGGKSFDCELHFGRAAEIGGSEVAMQWMMRDVTERNEAAREIARLNSNLEQRIAEGTAELQHTNLQLQELMENERVLRAAAEQARARAESAIESRDEFIASVSHEIRAPLTPVLAVMEDLDDTRIPADLRAELDIVRRNCLHAAALINDLLDVARIRNQSMVLSLDAVDIHAMLARVVESCTFQAQSRAVAIELFAEATRHIVTADAMRLEQVIWNILGNGLKFTPPGGAITVRTANSSGTIEIEITDTGIGIDPETFEHIFDVWRKGAGASGRETGLGLGLSIARAIVDLHGGHIEVESQGTGRGTTVRVQLVCVI